MRYGNYTGMGCDMKACILFILNKNSLYYMLLACRREGTVMHVWCVGACHRVS